MQLEDYFNFLAPNDIRLKGSRIGIETVLYEYLHNDKAPEEIQQTYPTLSLEQVYATILYYLHNKEAVSAYLDAWLEYCRRSEEEQDKNPSPATRRLLAIRAELEAYPPEERDAALRRIVAEREAQDAETAVSNKA